MTAHDDPNAVYALGGTSGESARLQRQSDELEPVSLALLDRVNPKPGDRVIDVGCGPRGILDLLAARVLPGGSVVGIDSSPVHVAMASQLVQARGFDEGRVEVLERDARATGLAPGSFDLVHARLVLVTVPRPRDVLAEMVRLTRPGGWVAGVEADMATHICHPADPAFERLCELFGVAFARNGADPQLGRRLSELYREAGLRDVSIEVHAQCYPHGHSRRSIRADLVKAMRSQIVAMGLADEPELDALDRHARDLFADPDRVIVSGLLFAAWGRKPG